MRPPIRSLARLTSTFVLAAAAAAHAQSSDTLTAAGLAQPVEILRDAVGISHIYARNEHDLFFAQGYVAASDRLFQLELWRRQATGTVAELLGPREIQRDIGARLFKFRGDMRAELARYHPHGAAIVRAFVDGINAYIAETERDPSKLPLEFRLLGTKPGRWTPEVVISRHAGLLGNITEELNLTRAVAAVGPNVVKRLESFHPAQIVRHLAEFPEQPSIAEFADHGIAGAAEGNRADASGGARQGFRASQRARRALAFFRGSRDR